MDAKTPLRGSLLQAILQFKALKVGDTFKAGSLFPKISDEEVVAKVTSLKQGEVHAVASWLGVTLGVWIGDLGKNDAVIWSFT